jgi:hypothetical protein
MKIPLYKENIMKIEFLKRLYIMLKNRFKSEVYPLAGFETKE